MDAGLGACFVAGGLPANASATPTLINQDSQIRIFEDAGGITLLADMPGVTKDRLDVKLDRDSLCIEGRMELDALAEMRGAMRAELSVPRFQRTFTLSRELDAGRIETNFKEGVLTLRVPKQTHAQPRRIQVTAG